MASGHDMKSAEATYHGFIRTATWGTGFCLFVVAIVVALITS